MYLRFTAPQSPATKRFARIARLLCGSLCLPLSACLQLDATPNQPAVTLPYNQVLHPLTALNTLEVKAFDVYQQQQTLYLAVAAAPRTDKKQVSVYFLVSEDGGLHWSAPVNISNKLPFTMATRGNDVQIAGAGQHLLALWQVQGELPGMGPLVAVVSADAGKTWQAAPSPAANLAGDQSHADALVDSAGNLHVVWLEDVAENGYQSVQYAKSVDSGMHWSVQTTLDDSSCSCCWNTLIQTPNHQLALLYRNMQPRDMRLLQSSDLGASWQAVSDVGEFKWNFDGCPHIGGGLAASVLEDNTLLHGVVWTGAEQQAGLYYVMSANNGKTWSKPHAFGAQASHADVTATAQQVTAIWDQRAADGIKIMLSSSPDAGVTWAEVKALSKPDSLATHPRVLSTSWGKVAMWTEKAPQLPSQWAMMLLP